MEIQYKPYVISIDIGCEKYSLEARWQRKPPDSDFFSIAMWTAEKEIVEPTEHTGVYITRHAKSGDKSKSVTIEEMKALRDALNDMISYVEEEPDK